MLMMMSRSGVFGQPSQISNGLHEEVSRLSICLPFAHGQSHSHTNLSDLRRVVDQNNFEPT